MGGGPGIAVHGVDGVADERRDRTTGASGGVVEDAPDKLESAFSAAAKSADVVITSGGVSVGGSC